MRQLTYVKRGTVQWWDVEEPRMQLPTDALVRPIAAARCDGDKVFLFHHASELLRLGLAVHLVDPGIRKLFGDKPFQGPFALGHECVAEVVSLGEDVSGLRPGDLVVVPFAISCGRCAPCAARLTSKCIAAGSTPQSAYGFGSAMGDWGGLLSDLVRVPFAQHMLVRVPEGVSPESVASASDNIPDAWRTVVPQLEARPGANVLVVGGSAASIGLYAAGIAVAKGAECVDYLDHDAQRLEIAASLGANPLPLTKSAFGSFSKRRPVTREGGYPIVVDASSVPDGLRFSLASLAPGGICTSVGYYFKRSTGLPLLQMYSNCSTLHVGMSHPSADLPAVLELIRSGSFRPEKVTTVQADWDDADQAFLERTVKVVVSRAPTQRALAC
jgi:alcohol dehydrogenase